MSEVPEEQSFCVSLGAEARVGWGQVGRWWDWADGLKHQDTEKGIPGMMWGRTLGFWRPTEVSSHPGFTCNNHKITSPLWGSVFSSTHYSLAWSMWKELKDGLSQKEEKQILYISTYLYNLGKWYWWTCLQGSGGEAAVENGLVGAMVEGESGMNGDSSIVIYTRSRVKWIVWCSVVT